MTPKENAINLYLKGIRDGQPREAIAAHTGARYTQHSTGVRDGAEGFIEFFEPFLERNPVRDIQIVRALQDGRHVFLHVYQSLNQGESKWVTTDFFDSNENGKIIEHWDVIVPVAAPNPSGRTQIDGPTDIVDLDKTDANRTLVRAFVETGLIKRDMADAARFVNADHYHQHTALLGDGFQAFRDWYQAPDCLLSYQECFLVVAEGNFVATLNRARWNGQDLCQADLFRVADGLIVEHWDNAEPVPPRGEWVNAGKF